MAGYYVQDGNSGDDGFTLSFYDGSGDTPGALVKSFALGTGNRVATGNLISSTWTEYAYQSTFSDLGLGAGSYFAALSNGSPTGYIWMWKTTNGGSQAGGATLFADGSGWGASSDQNTAFKLSSVPLPAAIWLFGPALAGLTGLGYQRRKQLTV